MRYKVQPGSVEEMLLRRIEELERRCQLLEANSRPTIPSYNNNNQPPDLGRGEYWIDAETKDLYYAVKDGPDIIYRIVTSNPA